MDHLPANVCDGTPNPGASPRTIEERLNRWRELLEISRQMFRSNPSWDNQLWLDLCRRKIGELKQERG